MKIKIDSQAISEFPNRLNNFSKKYEARAASIGDVAGKMILANLNKNKELEEHYECETKKEIEQLFTIINKDRGIDA